MCDNTAVSIIVVKYQRNISVPEERKESKYQGLSGFINKTFLRHCSAKHCLRHGSGGGIYFNINASDLLLSLGAKAQNSQVVCPSIFFSFSKLFTMSYLEEINFKISYGLWLDYQFEYFYLCF